MTQPATAAQPDSSHGGTGDRTSRTDRVPVGSPLLEARDIRKSFDAVRALQGVNLTIDKGQVTALLGDNGAGKSTLVRCLTGVHPPDGGEILFAGDQIRLNSPDDARKLGIETVYQELGLIEDLQVWQNLFLNRELVRSIALVKVLDKKQMISRSSENWTSTSPTCAPQCGGCLEDNAKASRSRGPPAGERPWSSWTSPPPPSESEKPLPLSP